jgi:hypothetical protein
VRRAYHATDVKRAIRLLMNLAKRLEDEYPSAAGSVREGLEETLTVLMLHLSVRLQRSLATTNAAESLLSRTRHVKRNVKPWRGGQMMLRWVAAGVLEAVKGFRRLKGHADMPRLVAALRARINGSASVSQWRTSRRISTEPPPNFNSGRDIPQGCVVNMVLKQGTNNWQFDAAAHTTLLDSQVDFREFLHGPQIVRPGHEEMRRENLRDDRTSDGQRRHACSGPPAFVLQPRMPSRLARHGDASRQTSAPRSDRARARPLAP